MTPREKAEKILHDIEVEAKRIYGGEGNSDFVKGWMTGVVIGLFGDLDTRDTKIKNFEDRLKVVEGVLTEEQWEEVNEESERIKSCQT